MYTKQSTKQSYTKKDRVRLVIFFARRAFRGNSLRREYLLDCWYTNIRNRYVNWCVFFLLRMAESDWSSLEQGLLVRQGFERTITCTKIEAGFAKYCTQMELSNDDRWHQHAGLFVPGDVVATSLQP